MKAQNLLRPCMVIAGAALLSHGAITAAEQPPVFSAPAPVQPLVVPASAPAPTSVPALNPTTPMEVSANVAEVLKLVRAQVNDDVIVAFIGSSKRTYILGANEIVYLRQQGVSDQVVAAMLNHQPPASDVPPAAAPAVQSSSVAPAATTTTTTYVAPAYVAPAPTYVYPAPTYSYYDYPYERSYWGFPWPAISLGFGFGFGHDHGHGWGHHHH